MAELKDSGDRRKFDSGAVRDIAEGKGRTDLMPLGVLAYLFTYEGEPDQVLKNLDKFIWSGSVKYLVTAVNQFCKRRGWDLQTMALETSHQFEDGATKYGERNWEKGIPVHCFIDSAGRHYLKWLRGDVDEPHDRACCWNILCAMWTLTNKADLNDLPEPVEPD